VNHLDFVCKTLGPEGFTAFCKGNALLLLLGGEPAEAAEYVALLAELPPTPNRCGAESSPPGSFVVHRCDLTPGHAGSHGAASSPSTRCAWGEERLGGVREPEQPMSVKEQLELAQDWRQLLMRQGETVSRCSAPATPEGHQSVRCEFPAKHGDQHAARSVNGMYRYAWDGPEGAVTIERTAEPQS